MENKIQPILCCVGAEVAGEPTQFLMERTASAAHLDWRVITVEVPADSLPIAWQGISVMRFRAVRFFEAYQGAAMNLVGDPTPIDQFIGGITSAHRVGDQWSMWHNSGPGLVDLLTHHCQWSEAVCWLHGDSPRQRSILAACCQRPPSKVFWSGSSAEVPAEVLNNLPLERIEQEREAELSQLLIDALGQQTGERSLIHLGEFETRQFEMLVSSQPTVECKLIVISNSPGTRRKLSDKWLAGKVSVLNQVDIVVAEEAFDQTRWIGYPPNIDQLREAYEEYADF